MKLLTTFFRYFVGSLFIFSGLIKLNDPVGFSFKLEEYFGPTVFDIDFLIPTVLPMAIFIVIVEVVLGVFLIIGFKKNITIWSLLLMIIFFTFLTWYSAYFNKVTDCGCFGDAIKLTPWESFTKDVVLLVMISFLYFNKNLIKPLLKPPTENYVIVFSLISCILITYRVLNHLPILDFRAYKIGDNLLTNMSIPENAPKAVQEFKWTFNVNGQKEIFITNGSYPEINGEYIGVETKIIEEGFQPPILDFSIESDKENLTNFYLEKDRLLIVVSYDLNSANLDGLSKLKELSENAHNEGYTVIGLSASGDIDKNRIKSLYDLQFDFFLCDEKVLKTMVRSNPGVLSLKKATVMQKVHWEDIEDLIL